MKAYVTGWNSWEPYNEKTVSQICEKDEGFANIINCAQVTPSSNRVGQKQNILNDISSDHQQDSSVKLPPSLLDVSVQDAVGRSQAEQS